MSKTDNELLELAAKAINLNAKPLTPFTGFYITGKGIWNPLESDGDALRLALDLGFDIVHIEDVNKISVWTNTSVGDIHQMFSNDKHAATRRAIARAAAAIGEAMQ